MGHNHRFTGHVTDKEKPNVIFSSNIPLRIASCVAEMHLFLGGTTSRLVELAPSLGELEIVVELNNLLIQNRLLPPYELVRRNLIFVAKSRSHTPQPGAGNGEVLGFTGVWRSIFAMKTANEVFVVCFRVKLASLQIDLAQPANVLIQFHHDDSYDLLAKCDNSILEYVTAYIRTRLLAELKSNTDICMDISNSNTILQELPVNELASQIKLMQNSGGLEFDGASFIDTTLDGIDTSLHIEKQLVFDDEDFDPSDEEIRILQSDDSGKCTATEDDDDVRVALLDVSRVTLGETDIDSVLSVSVMDEQQDTVSRFDGLLAPIIMRNADVGGESSPDEEESDELFIADLQNLRHNNRTRTNGSISIGASNDIFSDHLDLAAPCSDLSLDADEIHIDEYTSEPRDGTLEPCTPSKSAPLILNESSPILRQYSLLLRLVSPSKPWVSPTKRMQGVSRQQSTPEMQVRKKSSFAFVSNDDNSGLEFAFRDKSEAVPSFIKEDKKFKFIKVGKVQKFVSLFEEQMDKEPASNAASRNNTRPGSPLKRTE